jgi:predicted nucleic acid-binding Zn ribbon protein
MKCPNCGAEVREEDKFCGECGETIRREIEIAPKWKWGSMIASLAIVFTIWLLGVAESPCDEIIVIHIVWGVFAFPAIIYLMYKERTKKINYGLIWILLVVVLWILDGLIRT